MNIIKSIQLAEQKQKERKYDYLYWCIDLHGVILTPTYKLDNKGSKFYPYALETLNYLSNSGNHALILWTSSYPHIALPIKRDFEQKGIFFKYFNENPDFGVTEICDFSKKFFFDILLDDKAGFEGDTDWKIIFKYLTMKGKQ